MIFRAPIAAVSLRRSRKINYAFFNFFLFWVRRCVCVCVLVTA